MQLKFLCIEFSVYNYKYSLTYKRVIKKHLFRSLALRIDSNLKKLECIMSLGAKKLTWSFFTWKSIYKTF